VKNNEASFFVAFFLHVLTFLHGAARRWEKSRKARAMIRPQLFTLAFCLLVLSSLAQQENKGWFFLSHTQKLSKQWNILFDAQVRSTDRFMFVNTLLLRSGLSYSLNGKHSVALGYANKDDWEHEDKGITFQPEHRIYQQYLFETNWGKVECTVRGRFEQRFIRTDPDSGFRFSQRARAFAAFQLPVFANRDFSRGWYVAVQNEVFLNVTHRQNVNNSFFDQNRLYGSIGYRWSKKLDTELGYYWWRQSETDGFTSSHVYQLMFTTEL
jgi:hypothetical protein